jgi:penicillin-binding protein 1C
MRDITGITGAGPIWREMMEFLNDRTISSRPVPPSTLVSKYEYYYLEGTEPVSEPRITTEIETEVAATPKILYPPNGLIVAVDPDIPPSKQRLLLRSNIQEQDIYWFLNGAKIGSATKDIPWSPKIGKYKLSIGRDKNHPIDIVKFEVR